MTAEPELPKDLKQRLCKWCEELFFQNTGVVVETYCHQCKEFVFEKQFSWGDKYD